ncbi:hypothetical protein ACIBI8_10970 [Streptomyces sp. NPDC050529]|uniref:hypothetical protein n=1 Tax=Streptomyces sp. NPDC050529 TaxID=3365624 RepID=UPI0037BA0213
MTGPGPGPIRAVVAPPADTRDGLTPCAGDRLAVRPTRAATSATGLKQPFAELTELARGRRLADCTPTSEPGCTVLSAVEDGPLTQRRLGSYHRLLRDNTDTASPTDARLHAEPERPKKRGALLRCAIKQSPNFKA